MYAESERNFLIVIINLWKFQNGKVYILIFSQMIITNKMTKTFFKSFQDCIHNKLFDFEMNTLKRFKIVPIEFVNCYNHTLQSSQYNTPSSSNCHVQSLQIYNQITTILIRMLILSTNCIQLLYSRVVLSSQLDANVESETLARKGSPTLERDFKRGHRTEDRGIRRDTRVQIGAPSKMRYITSPLMNIFIELIYHSPLIPIRGGGREGYGRRRDTGRERGKERVTQDDWWNGKLAREREKEGNQKMEREIGEIERVPVFRSVGHFLLRKPINSNYRYSGHQPARGCLPPSMAIKTRSNCL